MNNTNTFNKRMDIWREYRDEISRLSLKTGTPFTNDKRLLKMINQINAIDSAILANLNNDIELSESRSIDVKLSSQYNALDFSINSLDSNLLNGIKQSLDEANRRHDNFYLVNADGNLSESSLEKFKKQDWNLSQIELRINDIEKRIQKFPQTATEDLTALNSVLEKIKIKLKEQAPANQVITAKIEDTRDWKKVYYISLITMIVALLICVLMTVLFLVL